MRLHFANSWFVFALACLFPQLAAAAVIYDWSTWTFPNSQTGLAEVAGYGTVTLTTQSPNSSILDGGILQFDNVTFTSTTAHAAEPAGIFPNAPWGYTLDLSSLATSQGLIVGLGNFGHDISQPAYTLSAFDALNGSVPLSQLNFLGSFDHTWMSTGFNDNASLDTNTGVIHAATTSGLNDINSDVLLFSLPSGVSRLEVQTAGLFDYADGLVVVVGTTAVPEPSSFVLVAAMVGGTWWKRRRTARAPAQA
jgi:hypothetical protein